MLENLGQNTIVLTPNRRLASHLRQEFDQAKILQKTQAWESPNILPIMTWSESLWENYDDPRILLTPNQELLLWQQVIGSVSGYELVSCATSAKEAFELSNTWNLNEHILANNYQSEDVIVFQRWRQEFINVCRTNNLITQSQILPVLTSSIANFPTKLPQKFILVGFEQLTPQLQNFLQALEAHNCQIQQLELNNLQSSQAVTGFATQDEELYAMARWAKQSDANSKIGCIVPNLPSLRSKIYRIFNAVFANKIAFNISAGENFRDLPLVQFIFTVLELANPISLTTLSELLLSPYFAVDDSEFAKNAMFIAKLKELNKTQFSWSEIVKLSAALNTAKTILVNHLPKDIAGREVESFGNVHPCTRAPYYPVSPSLATPPRGQHVFWPCQNSDQQQTPAISNEKYVKKISLFINELEKIRQNSHTSKASPETWARIFSEEIQMVTSICNIMLPDEATTVLTRFEKLFSEFAATQIIFPTLSRKQALRHLQTLASNTVFQQSLENCNINILGTLEAAGINFDYLWVSGTDEEHWPPAPTLNPFIPKELQKQLGLPHASAAKELQFCEALTKRFRHSAHAVIFSYVKQQDEHLVKPSPLVKDIPEIPMQTLKLAPYADPYTEIFTAADLETYRDDTAPRVSPEELLKGGSRILELQSLCPFRAFAEIRLQAQELPTPEFGISKKDRGNLIHLALELFCKKIQQQQQLSNLEPLQLKNMVAQCLNQAFTTLRLDHILLELEQANLANLLLRFLEQEKQREAFTVLEVEKKLVTKIGNIPLKLRIDRIDQLADGSKLIIDYKTGKNVPIVTDFLGTRPKSLQLPLYALQNKDATAFVIAQINVAKINFNEITLEKINRYLTLPEEKMSSWQELLNFWQDKLEQLAKDFIAGKAAVDPIDKQTCNRCSLAILCRV